MNFQSFINVINGTLMNSNNDFEILMTKIKTDTRTLEAGDIFFAIKGQFKDGHDFLSDAISKQVSCIVVEKEVNINTFIPIIRVNDTKQSLLTLAHYMRRIYHDIPLIAITGSVGKTTTKELISLILEKKYRVLKSKSSDNNYVGVPQTLFKLNKDYQVIVMELGMNHLGEISELSKVCQPNVSLITNIGSSHLGNLGSMKNILRAKLEIVDGMSKGILLLNDNDHYLHKVKKIKDISLVKVNTDDMGVDQIVESFDTLKFNLKKYNRQVVFNLPGSHFIDSIILAIKVGLMFDVSLDDIIDAIKSYQGMDKRLHTYHLDNDITLIDDSYNASYESIVAGLNIIKDIQAHKIIILGDVLELGKYSKYFHKKIGFKLKRIDNSTLLAVGNEVKYIANMHHIDAKFFKNKDELITYLNDNIIKPHDLIYIKGSRKMFLEEIRDYLLNKLMIKKVE